MAQAQDDGCDPETQDCSSPSTVYVAPSDIYPNKAFTTEHIKNRIAFLTENENYLSNIFEMDKKGLSNKQSKVQPWGGSYWPLNQGLIANNYQDKDYNTFIFTLMENINWQTNYNNYIKREKKLYKRIEDLDEKSLAKLAPSEKYDVLLGDKTFDLTSRIWNYVKTWGNQKKWGYLSKIDMPVFGEWRTPKVNQNMAIWEGICHGWALAAGHTPRPEKTVTVTLANGKKMPFYPDDIKALVSMVWANSLIQDAVMFEGNRCNRKNPDKDKFGRYIDVKKDATDLSLLPRCADVHPGIFHASIVNILGLEGRSFVLDHHPEAAVGNQPVSAYKYQTFNPLTGKDASLKESIISVSDYTSDPYRWMRNEETAFIVGIEMDLEYVNWAYPNTKKVNLQSLDKIGQMNFMYDLELDQNHDIIGGQWRVSRKGLAGPLHKKPDQPDFFWVAPRQYKKYFQPIAGLPVWDFEKSTLPPVEYKAKAMIAHSFMYNMNAAYNFGNPHLCPVFHIDKKEAPRMVPCEFKIPKPQPLIQIVDKLLEESIKKH